MGAFGAGAATMTNEAAKQLKENGASNTAAQTCNQRGAFSSRPSILGRASMRPNVAHQPPAEPVGCMGGLGQRSSLAASAVAHLEIPQIEPLPEQVEYR